MSEDGPTLKLGGVAASGLATELVVTVEGGPGGPQPAVMSRGPSLVVGRSPGADLRIDDPAVSAFHVELTSLPHGIGVKDEGSRNGTFVEGGVRVLDAVVPPGASLLVGTTTVRVDRAGGPRAKAEELAGFGKLKANSAIMRALFAVLARLGPTELSVLIEGPTGTGKELAADGIHRASRRAGGPFVVIDCTAIPKNLAESILFGHDRGAFTGATSERAGVFEDAQGGTVFIDEIGELPLDLQPKLLRVLEQRAVVRVGQSQARPVDVRIVAATLKDLRRMVNEGTFREDLYFRLAQAKVAIPPLADRRDDIATLVYHFLQTLPADVAGARMIARDALDDLKRRAWPGNVRELRMTVERAAMLAEGPSITLADLGFERMLSGERVNAPAPAAAVKAAAAADLPDFKEAKRGILMEFEHGYLSSLLARSGDNLTRASVISGIERHHLRDLLRKHGLRGT